MAADGAAEEQFGPYLVYERLGVGGMATVHRALERGIEGFERVVALKRLLPHLAADGSFIKSFVREAKLASQLSHINIVNIFELGRVGTEYFISMEYIDGRDIRRILRHARKVSGPPPIHITVGLLLQLCDALDYAHHKVDDDGAPLGIVHRDVSPSNLLVTSNGQLKVIDFGIAKAQSIQLRTQTGRVKGKLAYMAPEALTGKNLDARSDLFAAGIIAHELLTARPLFATKNEYETLMKVQRGDIMPPSTFNQTCPPELDAIVLRALARDPDERFATAAEMRDELLAMRRQYHLLTTERDIAAWLDWAFSLDTDGGNATSSFGPTSTAAQVVAAARAGLAMPKRSDDDDSIDIAWGGDEVHNGGPVVLDDVPDVSEKHLGVASSLGAEVRLDFDDLADDIPSSQPTHGIRPQAPSSRAATAAAMLGRPNARPRPPTPAAQLRSQVMPAQREHEHTTGSRGRIRTITIPPLGNASAPGTRPSLSPPPPDGTPALSMETMRSTGTPRAISTATIPPAPSSIPASSGPIATIPSAPSGPSAPSARPPTSPVRKSQRLSTVHGTPPASGDNQPTERSVAIGYPSTASTAETPAAPARPSMSMSRLAAMSGPSAEDFALPSDTIPSMPAMQQPSEPIIRFRAPSTPPPHARPGSMPAGSQPVPVTDGLGDEAETPVVGTPATSREEALALVHAAAQRIPVTPATALFAQQGAYVDPSEDDSAMTVVSSTANHLDLFEPAPLSTQLSDPPAALAPAPVRPPAPVQRANRRALTLIAGTLVLGGAVTGIALLLTHDRGQTSNATPPPPATVAHTGTIKLTTIPTDAEIAIAGQPLHVGSPWAIDLAPGVHQIEIHRTGYKAWLTSVDVIAGQTRPLNIALDALDPAVIVANATLQVDPPRGHEVLLDGTALPADAPSRHSLAIGTHTVVLRKDGVDVWKTTFDAKSAAVYDLTPILTREAERTVATPAAPAALTPAAPAPEDHNDGSAAQGSQLGTITPAAAPPVPAPPPH